MNRAAAPVRPEPAAHRYVMRKRADQTARTREAILTACVTLAYQVPLSAVTLSRVADRAGVSVQTVLRQFGSREQLFDAAYERGLREVSAERPADPEAFDASFDALVAHYEARGDGVLLLLAQESWEPLAKAATDRGRALHRDWVRRLFAPQVAAASDPEALCDALVVVTDVYAWKLLRRDCGLDVATTARRMRALVDAVLMPVLTPAGTPAGTARSTPAQPSSATRSSAPPAPPPA